jgi:hypothetical protein
MLIAANKFVVHNNFSFPNNCFPPPLIGSQVAPRVVAVLLKLFFRRRIRGSSVLSFLRRLPLAGDATPR